MSFQKKFAELAKKKREDSVNLIFEIILKFFKTILRTIYAQYYDYP
jgi:hypothetical protein